VFLANSRFPQAFNDARAVAAQLAFGITSPGTQQETNEVKHASEDSSSDGVAGAHNSNSNAFSMINHATEHPYFFRGCPICLFNASPKGTELDLTPLLTIPQLQAAEIIGMPNSTLSRKWKEKAGQRNWPYRGVKKVDRHIKNILFSLKFSDDEALTLRAKDVERLASLIVNRCAQLQPVIIKK
jgi:hypothetical protein